jgi:hypothetical protein
MLAHSDRRPDDEIIDFFRLDPGSFDDLGQEFGQQIIGPHLVKPVPGRVIGAGTGLGRPQESSNHNFFHIRPPFEMSIEQRA